ncbi:hypothetical protein V8C42DRAFT_25794 [Trichoderma barbatum]
MGLERWMQMKEAEGTSIQLVPEISLAACIIYTPHWLRWPEYTGLSEFPHPFRFIYRALNTDQPYLGESIKMTDIDQGFVMDLMNKVTSRIHGLSALDAVELENYVPAQVMCIRAEFERHHYERLTNEGYIAVNRCDMLVGPNLLWSPRDWDPIRLTDITQAPLRVIYGP